ncbi:MAG: prepilin-type N-terminal cleavage/methylation domain-containing protein [Patescibacteria group bacterium]
MQSLSHLCQRKRLSRGFTLLELVIVAGIIGIIASVITLPFLTFRQQTLLGVGAEDIVTTLNKARLGTMASKGGLQYGVHLQDDRIVLFQGASYSSTAVTNEVRLLDSHLTLSSIVVNGGGSDILFDFFTGATSNNATTTLSVVGRPQASSTIVVRPSGVVYLD